MQTTRWRMQMRDLDRRTLVRTGLAVGAGLLGGCDSAGPRPGSAYGGAAGTDGAAQGTVAGSLILPDSPLVTDAEQARLTTGMVRSHAITLAAGMVDLGGPVVKTWSYDGMV